MRSIRKSIPVAYRCAYCPVNYAPVNHAPTNFHIFSFAAQGALVTSSLLE